MEINQDKGIQHCGTKPKKIAFGIAPLGIISIGIVPMGVVSIGVVPMGVFSFGAVAMGIINLSVVGMGIISAGITTMGVWEYTPQLENNKHHHHKKISTTTKNKDNSMPNLFSSREEAEEVAEKYGCVGAHRMGKKWMPCKMK